MATSVSSKCAFSSAGITISKRHNRLKGDIVEALQCLKCFIKHNLLFHKDPMVTSEIQSINGALVGQTAEESGCGWDELVEDLADTEAQVVGGDNNNIDVPFFNEL